MQAAFKSSAEMACKSMQMEEEFYQNEKLGAPVDKVEQALRRSAVHFTDEERGAMLPDEESAHPFLP